MLIGSVAGMIGVPIADGAAVWMGFAPTPSRTIRAGSVKKRAVKPLKKWRDALPLQFEF
jgi:hypothetical protein